MKKLLTISLFITYLIAKLTYFSKKMEIHTDDEIKSLRTINNFLNEYISLDSWQAITFLNRPELELANHLVNYMFTYFIPVLFFCYIIYELISGKKRALIKELSKFALVVKDNVYISSYNIYVPIKNIKKYKNFNDKIKFGPYKGSKWKNLNEDYIVWLYNNEKREKMKPYIETSLLNFHKKNYK